MIAEYQPHAPSRTLRICLNCCQVLQHFKMNYRLPNLSPSVWPQEILVAQLNVSRDQCSRPYRPAARYAFLGEVHGVE